MWTRWGYILSPIQNSVIGGQGAKISGVATFFIVGVQLIVFSMIQWIPQIACLDGGTMLGQQTTFALLWLFAVGWME